MLTESIRTISAGGEHYRVAAVPTTDGRALILAQSLEPQEQVLSRLGPVMLLFGLAGVVGAAAAGWGVARNGLRPVRRLTAAVEEKARTEELAPLPIEGDDEIARLATAFNAMLAALEASRDRQRRLVADAGHELRTPLTSLRTNLDLLTQADETGGLPPEQKAELLDDVRAQIEELSNLVGDLVELARDEPLTQVVETFDLAEVVDRAVSRVRLRAPRSEFDVATLPWWVGGRVRRRRARRHQPARQRRQVGTGRRHDHGAVGERHPDRRRPGTGDRARRPAARVRALLPLDGVALDAGLGPGPGHRPAGGGAPLRDRHRGRRAGRRHADDHVDPGPRVAHVRATPTGPPAPRAPGPGFFAVSHPGGWGTATTPDIVWKSSRRRRPPQTAPSALLCPRARMAGCVSSPSLSRPPC